MMQKRKFFDLKSDNSGLALTEFAITLPFVLTMLVGGAEVANYAVASTQVTQVALQVADNASRIGEGAPLALKTITEDQINDLIEGARIHAGPLDLYGTHTETINGVETNVPNGRIIISSLEQEPIVNSGDPVEYFIAWQRCAGQATNFTPQYGEVGQPSGENMDGMGPDGRKVIAPEGTPVLFVEIYYRYKPLFINAYSVRGYTDVSSISAMMVRDTRDLSQVYNPTSAAQSLCV